MPAISIQHLSKSLGNKLVLPDLSLDIARGELLSLLGPNGSGKTTLFRVLSTLLAPDSGRVLIAGIDAAKDPAAVRAHIGVVFQAPSLDKKLTVAENLHYGGALYGLRGSPLRQRIEECLEALRIGEKRDALVETLSGGQQRRVEIAKALLTAPDILLMDEPSTGLDPSARIDLWAFVATLRSRRPMTILFTSHLLDESQSADRVAILHEGRISACDAPAALLDAAGPEVLRLASRHPDTLAAILERDFALRPHTLDSEVRCSTSEAHSIAARLAADYPEHILSTTIAKPTLEDVFLFQTGRRLHE